MSEHVEIENAAELDALKAELRNEAFEHDQEQDQEGYSQTSAPREFLGAQACAGLCVSMFDLLASRKGEQWKLKDGEAEQLGGALDRVLAKYIPAGLDKYNDETALFLIALGIIMPRLKEGDDVKA